ncbi:GNAT family N-acetyltransferase [Cupriavidus plantarum]|uniref:GNAT family N-acetyltransferase n=1 Tax=Cupriavidus plantarum TaxID=942865 RepID=UPI0015C7CA46|nr:GNAT family N-acetyltransferase [Cupriavidus plantarum]NYI02760.1 ribosomal protein S18 acetylase RimI-like enzyme [Cupriavidus plantarum]
MNEATVRAEERVIEPAMEADVPAIQSMVTAAYSKYIERLGMLPAAMNADYGALAATRKLYVLRVKDVVVGAVLLGQDADSVKVSNLVVDPGCQGKGYGRTLMQFAEDEVTRKGLSAVTLFTNELMHENIHLYERMGFVETGRATENGFNRVYFRKNI